MEKIKGFQIVLALLNSGPSQNNDDWAICYASSFFYEHSKIHVPSTCTKIISRHFFCKIHEFQIFLGKKLRFNYGQRIVIKTEWLGKNGTICGVLILKSENTGAKRDNDRKSLIRIKANLSYVLRLMTTPLSSMRWWIQNLPLRG